MVKMRPLSVFPAFSKANSGANGAIRALFQCQKPEMTDILLAVVQFFSALGLWPEGFERNLLKQAEPILCKNMFLEC